MSAEAKPQAARVAGFRRKLLVAMMLVVTAVTLIAVYFAERRLAANVEEDLQREFVAELDALERARDVRHGMLVERCRALVRRQRIRAAFEDDALDLLYDAAQYELHDVMTASGLRAQFYRFLDPKGTVISPPRGQAVGQLGVEDERRLALPRVPERPQVGYLVRGEPSAEGPISEIIAMPILSSETGDVIAAVVLGFKPFEIGRRSPSGMRAGIWLGERLHGVELSAPAAATLAEAVRRASAGPIRAELDGGPHLVFATRLNPDSHYAPATEVCLFPLHDLQVRQHQLRWQVLGAGALLLLGALGASHVLAARLSAPVEKLAVDSERSARFSADASHQLKTPVAVLRAGLEELQRNEKLTPEECEQVSALIHQTYRLSSVIEDLLLLSRMDAGRLKLEFGAVDLSHLIEASLDDLSALPDELEVAVETDFPADLHILGEKRYTAMILLNLLENARKYNRPGGRIRIAAQREGDVVRLTVANTGRAISPVARAHIFERFHRAGMGENVPGYGLGLNLARELARLHQGDLQLVRSDESWTEFVVTFRLAAVSTLAGGRK